ncbi:sperm flagellar protein 1-like isoform X2 [Gigantopelta aegis]|uniref:sperm flagellar protein 1-like isoform X2 n=1 Tax=Gigantopelta aegis TaxID=1735272 RepID=UPI001B88B218|nr:sperm flagellar protein 1-like isoform X2 [Gigantopelta aegis]
MTTTMEMEDYCDDIELINFYKWLDRIPFSRPKRNFGKDFSDGVLCCEIIKHYFPRWIELHNYTPAAATNQKMENWYLLNRRVLKTKLNMDLSDDVIRSLANGKVKVIERVLMMVRLQLDKALEKASTTFHRHSHPNASSDVMYLSGPPHVTQSINGSVYEKRNPRTFHSPRGFQSPRSLPNSHPGKPLYSSRDYYAPIVDNVPKALVDEKVQECLAKEETIQILHTKLKRLEHLLHLKDMRIEDLESRARQKQDSQLHELTVRRSHP